MIRVASNRFPRQEDSKSDGRGIRILRFEYLGKMFQI